MKRKSSKGQSLWKKAKEVIPGGNSLLSKRPEMFLPDKWPTYFKSANGCKVTDLDNNEYFDMSLMGVGTNILGYGNKSVDISVHEAIKKGNLSTLNCPEEVYLAERLINMHPWLDMARFARTGGEANAIAIRIARAYTKKDNVAICGYHGWHDWYLSTNLGNEKGLDRHLLPGLSPAGVPKGLKDSTFSFKYNDIDRLKDLISKENIGVVKMEVSRTEEPNTKFLAEVRDLCNKNSLILIFDECTSGFRSSFGGIHINCNVYPDIAIFGKALGNGYPITAVLGKKDIMQSAQSTFISSTFWTERIGYVAALKTLDEMEKIKSWEIISAKGNLIKKNWQELGKKYEIDISTFGISALPGINFMSKNNLAYKTLITQEMLKRGFLASNLVYCCINHTDDIIKKYFENIEDIFVMIKECEDGNDVKKLLEGPICHSSFERLN